MSSAGLHVRISADVPSFLRDWDALQADGRAVAATPFQSGAWLRDWYATLGRLSGTTPLCVSVHRGSDGPTLLLLPLVAERHGRASIVRFADAGVTDYNAPLLAGGLDAVELPALRKALVRALGRRHDLFAIDKMLPALGGRPNPLAAALRTLACEMAGNELVVDTDWDTWRYSLDKTVRKEFERTWRVFRREPGAGFVRAADAVSATVLFAELERQQRERMAHAGERYRLDLAAWRALYETRLHEGLADGSVVLTALRCDAEVVAVLYGISDGSRYVALRISHAGERWKHCAPGKLLLERTIHHLHGQGLRHIDFAIGDYFHKRVFKVSTTPLVDARVALSWRGLPRVAAWRMRRWAKGQPRVVRLVRRLKGHADR